MSSLERGPESASSIFKRFYWAAFHLKRATILQLAACGAYSVYDVGSCQEIRSGLIGSPLYLSLRQRINISHISFHIFNFSLKEREQATLPDPEIFNLEIKY